MEKRENSVLLLQRSKKFMDGELELLRYHEGHLIYIGRN